MAHPVNSRPSPHGGTGIFATSKIPPGQLVLDIRDPLVTVPDDAHLKECCSHCMVWKPEDGVSSGSMLNPYRDESPLSFCTGCRVVKYCSKNCQRADWKAAHKLECGLFKSLSPRILPGSVRVAIRMLFTSPGDVWSQIRQLESHEAEFRSRPERWEMVSLMAKGAHGYSRTILPEEEVRGLYCRLMINSITLVTPTFDPIGIAFDPLASLINHSCDPNSVMIFDGRSLSIRALKEIPQNEEITISYIDNTNPTYKRQSELTERYFFTCTCPRCTSHTPDPRDTFPCVSPTCTNTAVSLPKCTKCNTPLPQHLLDAGSSSWTALSSTTLTEAHLVAALRSLYALRWPLAHQPLPALHSELIHAVYIPGASWPHAMLHALLLYLHVDPVHYPQRHHPVRVVHAFTLAGVLLQVSADPTGVQRAFPWARGVEVEYGKVVWGLLCEVVAQVGMSHGEESGFAETVGRKREEVGRDLRAGGAGWVGMKVGEIGLEGEVAKVRRLVEGLVDDLRGTHRSSG